MNTAFIRVNREVGRIADLRVAWEPTGFDVKVALVEKANRNLNPEPTRNETQGSEIGHYH